MIRHKWIAYLSICTLTQLWKWWQGKNIVYVFQLGHITKYKTKNVVIYLILFIAILYAKWVQASNIKHNHETVLNQRNGYTKLYIPRPISFNSDSIIAQHENGYNNIDFVNIKTFHRVLRQDSIFPFTTFLTV